MVLWRRAVVLWRRAVVLWRRAVVLWRRGIVLTTLLTLIGTGSKVTLKLQSIMIKRKRRY